MKRKYLIILLAVGAVALASYWFTRPSNSSLKQVNNKAPQARSSTTLNALIIQKQNFANSLTLSGTIEPDEQVQIRSELSGVIKELGFQEGSFVQKGSLLIRMDDAELQAQLKQAKTKEQLNAENERRARLLLEKEAISSQEYDVAKADYESARAQTALIEAQLSKTRVYAPFSGQIGLRSVSVGEYLTPNTVVATLMNTARVKVLFSVPEKYSNRIRAGHPVRLQPSNSDQTFEARVYAVEPGVDQATRTMRIRAIADNPKAVLVPGSFTRVELPLSQSEDAILIPTYAVIPVQDGKQVYLYRQGKAETVLIETESRTSHEVLVTSGLQVGDTLITSGLLNLRPGMSVKVNVQEASITTNN